MLDNKIPPVSVLSTDFLGGAQHGVLLIALFGALLSPGHAWGQATGAAGGSTAVGADSSLGHCTETLGTVRVEDGEGQTGTQPAAALRLLIQQSNCFVIVERGGIGEAAVNDEKARARSPNNEIRDDANMGPGQEVAADYVLRGTLISSGPANKGGVAALPFLSKIPVVGAVGANFSKTKAQTQLVLIDVRAKIQIAVADGEGSASNVGLAGGVLSRAGAGAGNFSTSSPESKVMLQAFADAYNKMIPALQNYKAQNVKGGLGAGGRLGVQGSQSDAASLKK
jgi:curli biogenesis system outer membrane secretion channel CsgG